MWLLQKNIWKEQKYDHFCSLLDRYSIPHTIINLVPFSEDLELPCLPDQVDMIFGSIRFVELARQKGVRTHFNDNFNWLVWSKIFKENCLNHDCYISTVGALDLPFEYDIFVRPTLDDKSFTGTVLQAGKTFNQVQFSTSKPKDNIEIQVGSVKNILEEHRFFVVNQQVITGSLYKQGRTIMHRITQPDHTLGQFAQSMVNKWTPSDMFVIDIADTPTGPKIVEFGSIHNCGFYDCDLSKLIQSIQVTT